MKYFLRIEIRNFLHYAIFANNYVLHCILLLRSQSSDFQPEIVAILLHLIFVGDCPIIEVTNNEYMLCRCSLASSICGQSHLGWICLIIIDTHVNTDWTSGLNWIGYYASLCGDILYLISLGRCEREYIIAFCIERMGVCELCTLLHQYFFAIQHERQRSCFSSETLQSHFVAFFRDLWHRS